MLCRVQRRRMLCMRSPNQSRLAPYCIAQGYVCGAVANHQTFVSSESITCPDILPHSQPWLSARAEHLFSMWAEEAFRNHNSMILESRLQGFIASNNALVRLQPPTDSGLIGKNEESISSIAEALKSRDAAWQGDHVPGLIIIRSAGHKYAITVEEKSGHV